MLVFLQYLKLVVTLFPAIIELIKAIEDAIPQAGLGSAKLELLQQIVKEAYDAVADQVEGIKLDSLLKAVISIANKVVALFNKIGVFKTSSV